MWRTSPTVTTSWQTSVKDPLPSTMSTPDSGHESKDMPTVHELLLVGMGHKKLRPVLFARIGEEVIIYEAFKFSEDLDPMQLKIRFRKVQNHNMILKTPHGQELNTAINLVDRKTYFTAFNNVSVYNGVSIKILLI